MVGIIRTRRARRAALRRLEVINCAASSVATAFCYCGDASTRAACRERLDALEAEEQQVRAAMPAPDALERAGDFLLEHGGIILITVACLGYITNLACALRAAH